ncbi:MAG: Wzz/FepE/Etk N-terminal domain-containing protein, partial [Calditrichia bacterium]
MLDTKSPINPEQIIELALKHRWFIIIPFCLSMIVGIFLVFKLPKIYSAETLILIEPQRVPTAYVQSLVSIDISSRISTMKQQILSRTNIEKIIDEFKLLSGPEYENV